MGKWVVLGGSAVIGVALPPELIEEGIEMVTPAPEAKPFVKVVFEDSAQT